MLTINLVCVGSLKEKFWQEADKEYRKRLSRFCTFNVYEVDEAVGEVDKILQTEGKNILSHLKGKPYLLAIDGKEFSSEKLASELKNVQLENSQITFVIGSSHGVSDEVKSKISKHISFGRATYPHNLARIILLEQVYRAFMINSGAKYHK